MIPSEQGMDDTPRASMALPERSLGDLLNETFAIYGKRFGRIIGLAALIQVPVGFLGLIPVPGMATFVFIGIVGLLAMVALYGVTISAIDFKRRTPFQRERGRPFYLRGMEIPTK